MARKPDESAWAVAVAMTRFADPGPQLGQGRHRLVADPEIGVGHVPGGLLVADRDHADLVAALVQRIQHADVAVAAEPDDVRHVLCDQEIRDQLAALHVWHGPAGPRENCVGRLVRCGANLSLAAKPSQFTPRPSFELAEAGLYPWDQHSWLGCVASALGGIRGRDAPAVVRTRMIPGATPLHCGSSRIGPSRRRCPGSLGGGIVRGGG